MMHNVFVGFKSCAVTPTLLDQHLAISPWQQRLLTPPSKNSHTVELSAESNGSNYHSSHFSLLCTLCLCVLVALWVDVEVCFCTHMCMCACMCGCVWVLTPIIKTVSNSEPSEKEKLPDLFRFFLKTCVKRVTCSFIWAGQGHCVKMV